MSFEWKQYVLLAGELIDSHKTSPIKEAYFRCVVSRAYYGVFCSLRDLWESQYGQITERGSVHKFIIDKYKESNKLNERKIGIDLDRLRGNRNNADYNSKAKIDRDYALRAYEKSKQLLKQLEALSC